MPESSRRFLLISNSTQHGRGYLDHVVGEIDDFLRAARRLVFVPYALAERAAYGAKVRERLAKIEVAVETVTPDEAGREALGRAEAVFVGGGNTFRLLKTSQDSESTREHVIKMYTFGHGREAVSDLLGYGGPRIWTMGL